jgi:hypothetical protein
MFTWTAGQLAAFEDRVVARVEAMSGHGPRTLVGSGQ